MDTADTARIKGPYYGYMASRHLQAPTPSELDMARILAATAPWSTLEADSDGDGYHLSVFMPDWPGDDWEVSTPMLGEDWQDEHGNYAVVIRIEQGHPTLCAIMIVTKTEDI